MSHSFRVGWRARSAAWVARARAALERGAGNVRELCEAAEEFEWGGADMQTVRNLVAQLNARKAGHIHPGALPVPMARPRP